jgi:hypothetical protein
MQIVQPLRQTSDDLVDVIRNVLHRVPWPTAVVNKALYCYRSWVEYAVTDQHVTFEVLFPYVILVSF